MEEADHGAEDETWGASDRVPEDDAVEDTGDGVRPERLLQANSRSCGRKTIRLPPTLT